MHEIVIKFGTVNSHLTNGDVIKALFPEWTANHLKFHMGKNWWNSPSKSQESEE